MGPAIWRCTAIIAMAALSTSFVEGAELDPSLEELRSFTVQYDGSSRPDLITDRFKLMTVLGDAESMTIFESELEPDDFRKVNAFRQRLIEARTEDGKIISRMYETLCPQIRDLSGEGIAKEIGNIDQTIKQRQDSLTRTLLASLSSDGAQKVWARANTVATRVKGSFTDVLAMSKRFPEYVKRRYTQVCIDFGYLEKD
jgi:hypothetical protein